MKKLMLFFMLMFALPWFSSCSIADAPPEAVQALTGKIISVTLVSYTSSTATVNVQAVLPSDAGAPLSTIKLYTNSLCSGVPAGQGLANTFASPGIRADLPIAGTSLIYARSNIDSKECYLLSEYILAPGPVPDPTFTRTDPTSPNFDSYTPFIYGSAVSGSVVTVYSDASCVTPVGSGTAEVYNTIGFRLSLPSNQTSTLFGDSTDVFNRKSNCTHLTDYTHTLSLVSVPTFNQIIPSSPSNVTSSPVVRGVVPTGSVSVRLYNDSACNTKIGEGTPNDFYIGGIKINVAANVTTTIYAKSIDSNANASACMFLTNYLYDTIAPGDPSFSNSVPATPTRLTLYPKFYGSSPSDTAKVRLYNSSDCANNIGTGTKSEFELTGLTAALTPNTITTIYAKAFDAAGNGSNCKFLLNYKHNTIPPDLPVLNSTDPISPNNITPNPLLNGNASVTTTQLHFYSDELCTSSMGNGTAEDFNNAGIQIFTPNVPNSVNITTVYVQAEDEEGNLSECSGLGGYAYSTAKAQTPTFTQAFPASPSRSSFKPIVFGSAPASVSLVQLYSDAVCSAFLGGANRATFATQGIQVTVPTNKSTDIYATSVDVYGNSSDCVYFTTFVHDNITPQAPSYLLTNPISPNNISSTPLVKGNIITVIPGKPLTTSKVLFFDSMLCLTQISVGTPAQYTASGISVSTPDNTVTSIYAMAADDAGNRSGCTHITDYTYSTNAPGYPVLSSTTPGTPSYSKFFNIKGTLAANADIVSASTVALYKDSSCATTLANGTVTQFTGVGIDAIADVNAVTTVYGRTTDIVGTKSSCNLLVNFRHQDTGPLGMTADMNVDGSVALAWQSDQLASPIPNYVVKRSKTPGGPYTVLSAQNSGNAFRDVSVINGQTYYYVVAATNSTGTSYDSNEASITVSGPAAQAPVGLNATPADSIVYLGWTLNGQDFNYKLYRSTQPGGPYTVLVSNLTGASYDDTGLINGQNYYYVIAGVNANGESFQSPEISAMPLAAPPAPQNLKISIDNSDPNCGGSSSVTLTWTETSYFTRFVVRRGFSPGNLADTANTTNNRYVDCNPPTYNGTNNYLTTHYQVVAIWGQGLTATRSAASNMVSFYGGLGPLAPTAYPGNNQISVSWLSTQGAISYQVWRSEVPGWPNENYVQLASNHAGVVYLDTTAVNDKSYFYVVIANYASASGFPSPETSAVPKPNPTAPSGLVVTLDSVSQMPILSWKASNYANNYTVYRSYNGGSYSPMSIIALNSMTDALSSPGVYSYYVTANWGSYESPATNVVSFRYGALLSAPTAISTGVSITLSWTSVSTAISYNIWRGTSANGPMTLIGNTTSTTYANTTSVPAAYPAVLGQGYFYSVQPVFTGNAPGQVSAVVDGMLVGPTVVSGLTVTGTTGSSISLTWAKLAANKTYHVYRSLTASGTYTKMTANTNTNTYIASSGLNSNTLYYFKVGDGSCSPGCLSTYVSAMTVDAPLAPTVKGANGYVEISGFGVGASSYEILRSTDLVNYTVVASGLPTPSANDPATNGVNYYYRIRATYSDGSQLTSSDSAGVTPGIAPEKPGQIYLVDNSTGSSVILGWAKVGGASDYVVYYGNSSGGPYTASQVSTGNTVSISGLASATTYYFVARSRVGLIESADSSEIAVRPDVTPPAPTLQALGTSIGVSWTAVAGATSYNLLRSNDKLLFTTIASGTAAISYTDAAVTSGSTYYYQIIPYAGVTQLPPSAIAGPINIEDVVPASSLTGESVSGTAVKLTWTSSPSQLVVSYNVYRSTTSGGPYSLIQTTGSTISSYLDIDPALTAGVSYYYVVKSVNNYGQLSPATNEVAVRLSTGPTLSIGQTNGVMNLSWSGVGGATQYNVYRSKVSGGPYGLINTTSSLSYQDSSVTNGVTYYYVATAIYANGDKSIYSNEVNQLVVKTMNLRVPVELIDQGLASDVSPATFERSRTSLETTAYDGVVTYDFEVVATNIGGVDSTVSLVDETDNTVAQVTVLANSTSPIRLSGPLTPVAGFHTYRLKLAATANASDLQVYSGKVWINQTGATRTKLYYPLIAQQNSPLNGDMFAPIESTTNSNLTVLNSADEFVRDLTHLSKVPDYNGWEFESVVSTYGSHGLISLYNTTTGQSVKRTETIFSDTDVTLFNSSFDEGVPQFASGNHLNKYKVAYRCYLDCELGGVNVFKSGLWVKLENMTQVEVLVRQSTALNNILVQAQNDRFRTTIDLSNYSNASAYFRAYAKVSNMGDNGNVQLVSNGSGLAADSGFANLSLVTNSSLYFTDEVNYSTKQTASPLVINNQDRFMTQIAPSMGGLDIRSSYIVIQASP